MKKLISAAALMFVTAVSAQAWTGKGDQKVQAGLNAWGYGTGITATYDYGIANMVSIGAGANIYFSGYRDNNSNNNVFAFGRVNFHLNDALQLPEQWDIYPGLDLGVLGGNFGLGVHLGARYFFTQNWGAYLEAGNNGSIGVSYNF